MTENQVSIIKTALSFWNEYEIEGNLGFKNPYFESLMKMTGWQRSQAWCVYFVELVLREAGFKEKADLLSAGAVESWKICSSNPKFVASNIPQVGDLAFWQTYQNGSGLWTGHAGIVVRPYASQMITIEGNTNAEGGRDGIQVALSIRMINYSTNDGLRLLGFVR